jgi:hypothetical protein
MAVLRGIPWRALPTSKHADSPDTAIEERVGLFEAAYERIGRAWVEFREPDRWPTQKNWALRVAPDYTREPDKHLEMQLEKESALAFELEARAIAERLVGGLEMSFQFLGFPRERLREAVRRRASPFSSGCLLE